jgi:hypothetical protein
MMPSGLGRCRSYVDIHLKQLVVLHKAPKNFDITSYLDGFVKSHDHKAFQEAQRKKAESGGSQAPPEA